MAGELLQFTKTDNAVVHFDPAHVVKVEEARAGDKLLLLLTTEDGDRCTVFDDRRDGVRRINEARAALFAPEEPQPEK